MKTELVNIAPEKLESLKRRFWAKVEKAGPNECWIWNGSLSHGYGQIGSGTKGKSPLRASRVSWIIHFGQIPARTMVLHKCDNPRCVNPEHLKLGDHALNMRDRSERGRTLTGELNPHAKLTADKVRIIRQTNGRETFGISDSGIRDVLKRRRWAHVQ